MRLTYVVPIKTALCTLSIVSLFQQPLLRKILGKATDTFQYLFASVADHFELCLAKCRTSSQVRVGYLFFFFKFKNKTGEFYKYTHRS